jgi:hypothetical protein
MNFKERFQGRTTTMKKEGFIETFAAQSNPVGKSQSNSQLPSSSKINSTVTNSFQVNTTSHQRHFGQHSVENRPQVQAYPSHSYSKSPVGHSYPNQNVPTQHSSASCNTSAVKNPYLVSNPFPSFDMQEDQGSFENGMKYHRLNPKNIANQLNNQQNVPMNEFNPNSFYNQHSQFRNNEHALIGSPFKENIDRQGYGYANQTQMVKKNFEDLSQQNKQKRMAGEALRDFENQNMHYQMQNNRFEGYDQVATNYNNGFENSPPPMNGYSGPRDIHSNPVPHHHLEANAFGHMVGNMTHQAVRGRQNEDSNPFHAGEGGKNSGYSKTSYKPYSLKDYKDTKNKASVQLGGLGPNVGADEWQKSKEKKDKMSEFSQNVKMFNAHRATGMENNIKPRKDKEKESSKREIALKFAKNVPKPKPKRDISQDDELPELGVQKAQSDKPVNYGGYNDLDELEQKHMQYLAQLERMKIN